MIRAIIVDDELPARERVRMMVDGFDDVEIIGECANGLQAVESILELQPDLVMLDSQMPEFSGFDVIQAVGVDDMPTIIFVTAYDQFAVRAFEVHAIDYLLKPFDESRLQAAIQKAKREITLRSDIGPAENIQALLTSVQKEKPMTERILVRTLGRVLILHVEQIDWISSAGNYVLLHVGKDEHILRETMKHMEARLDPQTFIRVHRTTIVNVLRIKELQPRSYGDYTILLNDGTELTLSRRFRDQVIKLLEHRS